MVQRESRQKVLVENHDAPVVGHVGINRTVNLIKRAYRWRGLWADIATYVRSCSVCQRMKIDNRKKAGVLQPISIPKRAWQQITTDLVTDLPESEGKTAIAVFVDRLTKMTHLVPCTKEVTATQYAWLLVDNVF